MTDVTRETTIINKLGLHARAAAHLVSVTNKYTSQISIEKNGIRVDAKSILGMMTLAAGPGTSIRVHCIGDDAEAAADAVCECIANKFGEAE